MSTPATTAKAITKALAAGNIVNLCLPSCTIDGDYYPAEEKQVLKAMECRPQTTKGIGAGTRTVYGASVLMVQLPARRNGGNPTWHTVTSGQTITVIR